MQPQRRARLELVDALRAFALFGILQVNIQSFVWGAGDPLGAFAQPPRFVDSAAYLLVATFVSSKFISLFALLFGFGFALQFRAVRRALGSDETGAAALADAKRVYRRRLWFLLALGVAHGTLLYFGDILTAYALCGFIVVLYAGVRTGRLAQAARNWWITFAVVTFVVIGSWILGRSVFSEGVDPALLPPDTRDTFATYTSAGYAGQLAQRAEDYFGVLVGMLFMAVPMVVALFLLGALAARLGWLSHPERHPRVWRAAMRIGAVGLVFAAIGAWLNYRAALTSPGDPNPTGYLFTLLGAITVAMYVALIVRWRESPAVSAAVRWLAPAGRMPLTNYLMQSVFMGALLSGWGLGLGASLRHAELAALALAIVVVQVMVSRVWIARFGTGPVEALWRRATYGGRN